MPTKKLSPSQQAVLAMACSHGDLWRNCYGRSEHGARTCTITSLFRLGMIDGEHKPTDLGRERYAATLPRERET